MSQGCASLPDIHRPVLLREAIAALDPAPDGIYVDATFGRGGHSRALLEALGPRGRLIALDRDPEAIAEARRLAMADPRVTVCHDTFASLLPRLEGLGLAGKVRGILADLGVSSPQLEDPGRGFSFRHDGPLDMRMDPTSGEPVSAWLARARERDIADVLFTYGEERHARRIARAIVEARRKAPVTRTLQLASIIARAHPRWERGRHPATRSFQALRIFINRELEALEAFLEQAVPALEAGGRLVVISFHSLEDRRVKRFIRREAKGPELPGAAFRPALRALGKVRPSPQEVAANPRARSAIMRVAEKLP